jgi:hypothetical protein
MELKLRRFSELLAIFFIINSLTIVLDEVSSHKYSLYTLTNDVFESSSNDKFRFKQIFDYALVLKRCDPNQSNSDSNLHSVTHSNNNNFQHSDANLSNGLFNDSYLSQFLRNQSQDLESYITVEATEELYYNSHLGDSFWVFYTPFYHRTKGLVKVRQDSGLINNPLTMNFSFQFSQAFGVALFIILLSFLSYKSTIFEWKITAIVFAIIFSIVQHWWI